MDTTYRRYTAGCRTPPVEVWSDFCAVAPSPELADRLRNELANARGTVSEALGAALSLGRAPRQFGFNDGVIIPPEQFPLGTSMAAIRSAAADRAPLRGALRVVVVLVQFSDRSFGSTAAHFNDLFFSTGVLPHGSVKEFYREVSGGLVDIVGEVVGPFTLPQTLAWYANGNFGIGKPSGVARAPTMAKDAAVAANPSVNYGLYDNDGNGFVDAFIVVHAGSGGEQSGNPGDIWSHKWTLPSAYAADGKQLFAYLTIPQDARVGVCAHELGHLLFGFPDLYDTDSSSEGIGNWCLMAGGSWNGGGDVPAHPSAWCKVNQGWVAVNNVTSSAALALPDVKTSRTVHRLWKDGAGGGEYFLLENRQRTGFDANLPGDGLLIWHIDESQPGNTDENHYKVALMQADGRRDMETHHSRGDPGDPYPGSSGNATFGGSSTPNSKSYANQDTCVAVTQISASAPSMSVKVSVTCKAVTKDLKDTRKEIKEMAKELKDARKETKEVVKERKELKDRVDVKRIEIPHLPGRSGAAAGARAVPAAAADDVLSQALTQFEARLSALEAAQGDPAAAGAAQPFIGAELRPALVGAPADDPAAEDLQQRMGSGDRDAKRAFDGNPWGLVILAHPLDAGAHAVAGRLAQHGCAVRVVRPEALGAARWSQTVDARGRCRSRLRLPDGQPLADDEVAVLWNRIRELPLAGFRNAAPNDRDYAVAELHALVASWLAGLGERVEPPMRRHAAVTAWPQPLHWAAAAAACGLALAAGPADAQPPQPQHHLLLTPDEAVPRGSAWQSPVARPLVERCRALAAALGFAIVEFAFAGTPGEPVLCGVDSCPPLADTAQVAACARWLERRHGASSVPA